MVPPFSRGTKPITCCWRVIPHKIPIAWLFSQYDVYHSINCIPLISIWLKYVEITYPMKDTPSYLMTYPHDIFLCPMTYAYIPSYYPQIVACPFPINPIPLIFEHHHSMVSGLEYEQGKIPITDHHGWLALHD